ncbi:MAG: hypothetical protein U9Q80_07120 [Bacillota bacterium]|nr:hypothetical protein [Bacillota bacterium]
MMPYEKSGRADKSGNRFEIRVVVYHMLKLLEEKIDYVILEPKLVRMSKVLICGLDIKMEPKKVCNVKEEMGVRNFGILELLMQKTFSLIGSYN